MTKARLYSSNVQHKKSEIDRFIMNHHHIGMDGGIGIMYIHTLWANVIYLPKIFLIKFINNNFSFILRIFFLSEIIYSSSLSSSALENVEWNLARKLKYNLESGIFTKYDPAHPTIRPPWCIIISVINKLSFGHWCSVWGIF